jgi:hypothetical protein
MKYKRKRFVEQKPPGYWQDWEKFLKEMNEVIKSNGGDFPNQRTLREIGRSDLEHAAVNYYDGLVGVRIRMKHEFSKMPKDYWKYPNNFYAEIESVLRHFGTFPTNRMLRKIGEEYLSKAFKYHGGIDCVKMELIRRIRSREEIIL